MKTDRLRLAHNGFLAGTALIAGLLCGCAWDNSPPPLHSVLRFERTGTDLGWATREHQSSTNVVTSADWQTNQIQGAGAAGYGAAGGIGMGSASGGGAGTASRPSTIGPVPGTLTPTPTTSGTTPAPSSLSTVGTSAQLPSLTNSAPTVGTSRTNSLGLPQ